MILRNELVYTACEYKSNKMVIAFCPADMLVTENWEPVRLIPSASAQNIDKYFIQRHPEFDEVKFPFLICSGIQFYVIINVKDYRMEQFID